MMGQAMVWSAALQSLRFMGYLLATLLIMLLIGQKLALPLFAALYLCRWAGQGWRVTLFYALVTWATLIVFYDQILNVLWYRSWLAGWLPSYLPDWLPAWLIV